MFWFSRRIYRNMKCIEIRIILQDSCQYTPLHKILRGQQFVFCEHFFPMCAQGSSIFLFFSPWCVFRGSVKMFVYCSCFIFRISFCSFFKHPNHFPNPQNRATFSLYLLNVFVCNHSLMSLGCVNVLGKLVHK